MSIGDVIRCAIEPGGTRNRPVLYSTEMVLVEIVGRPARLVKVAFVSAFAFHVSPAKAPGQRWQPGRRHPGQRS